MINWLSLFLGLLFVSGMAALGGPRSPLTWVLMILAVIGFSVAFSMKLEDTDAD